MTSHRSSLMLFVLLSAVIAIAIAIALNTNPPSATAIPNAPRITSSVGSSVTNTHRLSKTVWLTKGSTLVVGSLDLTAQHHIVSANWEPAGRAQLTALDSKAESMELFAVHRVPHSGRIRGNYFEPEEYADQALPPVECESEASQRRFAVPYFPGRGGAFERTVIANVVAAGATTRVYLADDSSSPELLNSVAHEIVHLIEIGLREFVEDQLTTIEDVDFDNHLTIVMCQLADDDAVGPGEEPIRGCVREKDFLDLSWEFAGDIIYVDVDLPRGRQLAAVLAHELAHAATFSAQRRKNLTSPDAQRLPYWLNEGIAHLLEYSVCPVSDNLRDRLARYSLAPNAFPLVLPDDYENRVVRRGPARAAALSFLRFLAAKRPDLLSGVLESGADGIDALELGTGYSFEELFREWTVSGVSDTKASMFDSDQRIDLTIAGTSFAMIYPGDEAGYLTIEASENALLQLTVVEPDEDASNRLSGVESSRF